MIRIVQLHPNKLLGLVGQHQDFPVECIKLAPTTVTHEVATDSPHVMASCSHDNRIKFWDVGYLFEEDEGDEGDDDDEDDDDEQDDAEGEEGKTDVGNASSAAQKRKQPERQDGAEGEKKQTRKTAKVDVKRKSKALFDNSKKSFFDGL
jgi:hypothetical protein